jgi:hypothetical protein
MIYSVNETKKCTLIGSGTVPEQAWKASLKKREDSEKIIWDHSLRLEEQPQRVLADTRE